MQELGLTAGQFSSVEAKGRVKMWVEMVTTSFWNLWPLTDLINEKNQKFPKLWRDKKITLGAVRRIASGFLMESGWQ